ncbi:MAG: hypothetical protein EAZ89_08315 [Bacteroidetes bacterium]|nr:MAG: hypothetical protein EAZ89_08315 [Bacteroidota bacterium]
MKTKTLILTTLALLLSACQQQAPTASFDFEKEKEAIKAVIAEETESYYRQDFAAWQSTYLDSPAFRKYAYWEGFPHKVEYYNGFDTLRNQKRKQFEANETLWQGSTEERQNENFRISPDMAWYTFEQYSYEKDTRKLLGVSLETRILEKHQGQWKIAYLGYHYLPDTLIRKP